MKVAEIVHCPLSLKQFIVQNIRVAGGLQAETFTPDYYVTSDVCCKLTSSVLPTFHPTTVVKSWRTHHKYHAMRTFANLFVIT
jgi:hypothetical protein